MSGKPSADMERAMELVRGGMTPYAAAKEVRIALSTIYRSPLYKAWRALNKPKHKEPR